MSTILGTAGADTLSGTNGNDVIHGFDGNDTINGNLGFDSIRPGNGNDRINGGPGDANNGLDYRNVSFGLNFRVDGGKGTVTGASKSDSFLNIILFAGTLRNDTFVSGALTKEGSYSFTPGKGHDTVTGRSAFDELRYGDDEIVRGISANLTTGVIVDGYGDRDTVSGIERIRATRYADQIIGSNAPAEHFQTYGGADRIDGRGGMDQLDYHREFDQRDVNGNLGLHGVTVNVLRGYAIDSYGYRDTFLNVERFLGTKFADRMYGSPSAQELRGEKGNDIISGFAGNDLLIGDEGDDTLNGGAGNDTLTGAPGRDFFLFTTALNALTNIDTITDFRVADDTIRLDNAVMAGLSLARGTLSPGAFASNASGLAGDAGDRIIYETDTGKLFYDSNGSQGGGTMVQFARLAAGLLLTYADFVII